MEPAEAKDVEPAKEHDPTIAYAPEAVEEAFPEAPAVHGAFAFALVVERGPRAGMAFILAPGETLIGRSADANIFLDDVTVSRSHARLQLDGDTLVLEDLGSLNGTYVNRERVERASLAPGDEIIIGKYHLIVARGDG